jgi:N,N'-diacetylbacillosaminyl-diphospho-undecaprenol alpha-1,3-N-acetylgalactosaminyltransferase
MFKIALVSNTDYSMYYFRLGLIRALLAKRYDVHIVCPDGKYVQEFEKEGVKCHRLYVDRKGTNPFNELRTIWQLLRIFKKERFDLVHTFTVKPNIYGSIAAKFAGVPAIMNSVTGLGYVFIGSDFRRRLLKGLVVHLYRFALKSSDKVIFENEDDFQLFLEYRMLDSLRGVVIKSVGVNTAQYSSTNVDRKQLQELVHELNLRHNGRKEVIVTLMSRLLWDKGIREFIDAARILKPKYPQTLFLLGGPIDKGNPAAIPREYGTQAEKEGLITYLAERSDILAILHISDIFTLPSYREGIPRVLLEAMSMEKPIVTTNSVGCKEVVEEGKNGFLVPVKDSVALASAIEKLINNEELRIKMGKYGREKVLREFDERIVVSKLLQIYEELLANCGRKNG